MVLNWFWNISLKHFHKKLCSKHEFWKNIWRSQGIFWTQARNWYLLLRCPRVFSCQLCWFCHCSENWARSVHIRRTRTRCGFDKSFHESSRLSQSRCRILLKASRQLEPKSTKYTLCFIFLVFFCKGWSGWSTRFFDWPRVSISLYGGGINAVRLRQSSLTKSRCSF